MRKLTLLLTFFTLISSLAQDVETIQNEIDQNLWKPFKTAFQTVDGPALNSLYADKVLRVTPNGIDTENKFKDSNLKRFEKNIETNTSVQLDFWFDSRHTNSTTSYEVGFYRMNLSNADGENIIYGQFHIVLEKIDGTWKITQDWDTTEINGTSISAVDFEKQKPLEFE